MRRVGQKPANELSSTRPTTGGELLQTAPHRHNSCRVHPAAIAAALVAGAALGGCNGWRTPVDPYRVTSNDGTLSERRLRGELPPVSAPGSEALPSAGTFGGAYRLAMQHPADEGKAKSFAKAGIALSDELCASWFQVLERAKVNHGFDKDLVTNAGALTAVFLELARAGSGPITGAAAAASFLSNTLDSHVANFVVAPDLGVVKDAIDKSRAVRAAEIELAHLDFYKAYSAVIRYDYSCSHSELKRIVNASVKKTGDDAIAKKPEAVNPAATLSPPRRPAALPGRAAPSAPLEMPAAPAFDARAGSGVRQLVPGLSPPIN
jgi:hypothetical protein